MKYKEIISIREIQAKIYELSASINTDYKDVKELVVVPVLKGAMVFTSDLIRTIKPEIMTTIHPITTRSYDNSNRRQDSTILSLPLEGVDGKDVLIVEDIVDSGSTIDKLRDWFVEHHNVRSLKVCSLLVRERKESSVDYYGFVMKNNDFVFGYGLDYSQKYRNLENIVKKV